MNIGFFSKKEIVVKNDVPVQILFDVSLSMLATDMQPSRFDVMKNAVGQLLLGLSEHPVSLIAFSGAPFVYSPFSVDAKSLLFKWNAMDFSDFPPDPSFVGTAIGDALLLALNGFEDQALMSFSGSGVVVLITDGDSNMGIDPQQVLSFWEKYDFPIFVFAVGHEDYLLGYDYFDVPVMTSIDIALLREIADRSSGKFYRILSVEDFEKSVEAVLSHMEQHSSYTVVSYYYSINRILWYALWGLLVVFLLLRLGVLLRLRR